MKFLSRLLNVARHLDKFKVGIKSRIFLFFTFPPIIVRKPDRIYGPPHVRPTHRHTDTHTHTHTHTHRHTHMNTLCSGTDSLSEASRIPIYPLAGRRVRARLSRCSELPGSIYVNFGSKLCDVKI